MKRASVAVLVLTLSCGFLFAADQPPAADPKRRVSAVLEGFPADAPAKKDALCAEILSLGPGAIAEVCARVLPPGVGDDSRARFAVNGLAVHVMRPGAEIERTLVARVLLDSLARTSDTDVAAFFLSQIQLVGRQESIRPLAKYLVDETLAGPATSALLAIGGPSGTQAMLKALDEAPRSARLALLQALGEARSREAVKKILPFADSADESVRQAALFALANIGDPAAGPVLSRSRVLASHRERAAAPSLYLLYARRLVESGHTTEGLQAARAILERYRQAGESQHASAALAQVVSCPGAQSLPDLLTAADSPDRAFRGSALTLAERIPGSEATLRWVERAGTASPEVKADIVGMLGQRGDTAALPFVRESLRSPDEVVRLAAIPAAAHLGGPAVLPDLLPLFGSAGASESAVLKTALLGYPAALVVPEASRLLDSTSPPSKAALIEVLGEKGARGEKERIFRLSEDPEPAIRDASLRALAHLAQVADLPRLASMLERPAGSDPSVQTAVLAAIAGIREPESLRLLARCLERPGLRDAAAAALLDFASRQSPEEGWLSGHEAYSVLRRVEASLDAPAARQRAGRIIRDGLRQGGFVPLFDGRSLDGWKGLVADPPKRTKLTPQELASAQAAADETMRAHWTVVDGVLAFDGKGESLCTRRDYADFELVADWKIEQGGDSGFYLRGSPQVQIWDAEANPAGSGGLFNNKQGPSQPLEKADRPVGEWNAFRIFMIGERATVYLNDKRVVDNAVLENYWERDKPIDASGQIELQAHGNPLWFRNVFVREIPREAAVPTVTDVEASEGFTPLFGGRDLEGWTGKAYGYAAEDGKIVVHPERGGGNLYSAKEYTDFVLRFEFKLTPAANNGLGIRAPLEGDAAYVGMELQILEDGSPVHWGLQPYQYHGSVYGVVPARRGLLRPVGEWNSEQVTVQGRRVSVVVNGTTAVDADLDEASAGGTMDGKDHPGLKRASGHIGFLGHGSSLEFRNIRIKEIHR